MSEKQTLSSSSLPETTIYRCPHNKSNLFFVASQALARDNSLSFGCRGLLMYLLSMADNWIIRPKQIADAAQKDGRDHIYTLINEAIEHGYLVREDYLEGGLKRYRYRLVEDPKSLIIYPSPGKPDTGNPDPASLYKEVSRQEISISSSSSSPPPPSSPSAYSEEEEEEFERVMKERALKGHSPVHSPDGYKRKVIERFRQQQSEQKKKERGKEDEGEMIARRKKKAESWPLFAYSDGITVRLTDTSVEVCSSPNGIKTCSAIGFKCTKEEWNGLQSYLSAKARGPSERAS